MRPLRPLHRSLIAVGSAIVLCALATPNAVAARVDRRLGHRSRQDWPVVNHDRSNTRANTAERKLSPRDVARLTPRWRVDGLSGVTSTPAVVGGVVYFGDWGGVV